MALMPAEHERDPSRRRYTVLVEQVAANGYDIRIRELPKTWTVAFTADEVEQRARHRIALDIGVAPDDFDVLIEFSALRLERRAYRRE